MPEAKVPLVRGDRAAADAEYRAHLPKNCMTIMREIFDVVGFMVSHPGYDLLANVSGRSRGAVYNERLGEHLRVCGQQLNRVNADNTVDELGFINGNDGPFYQASLPYSFNTQAIITAQTMYLYDGTTITEVGDPDLGDPIDGCWVDGYYFLTDGEYLYHTELTNEASIEPLKFATAEYSPDPTLGVGKTADNQVIVFNRYTTEFFYNAGNEGFVFSRVSGKATKAGIVATHLKIEMGDTYYCLGSAKDQAPTMLVIGAGSAISFATREIDDIISGYSEEDLQFSKMSTRVDNQQQLVYVHLPKHTLMFNKTVADAVGLDAAWTYLAYDIDNKPYEFVDPVFDPLQNEWIGGDRTKFEVYRLNDLTAGQDGQPAEIEVFSPFLPLENASVDEVEIRALPGQDNEHTTVFVSVTYDGVSYSKEWALDYSQMEGDYRRRVIIRRLGYVRNWVGFRFRVVSKAKINFCDMVISYG